MDAISSLSNSASADGMHAFLFSDIEGSTLRWERSPEPMRLALARHDAVMRSVMEHHAGHVFKTVGDAFCVAFSSAVDATAAAIAAQLALTREDFSTIDGLPVRIGVHAGTAELRDGDYFGAALNRVARLMATAHGGQIVISGAVAGLLNGVVPADGQLLDLGQHRLKDLTKPEHVFQITAPGLGSRFPPLRSLSSTPNNLPQQPNAFVGRQAELDEVCSLLEHHRLVTLIGSGGSGKTRLSLQIGAELLEHYPDGVWIAELAPLTEDPLVAETVANLFSLPGSGNRSATDVVADFLKHKKLLLILDNCEHLVAATAALADALIGYCPQVSLLASSREPLQIPAEQAFRTPMLSLPPNVAGISAAEALKSSAVELFVERARASLGRYELSDPDAPSVAAICRQLDGIALAIELAAPRLKMLKPAQLLRKLDDRFHLLTGGSRTALPRQQTLRAMIDWSHYLLSEPEQALMRRLSVFADGWTLDAAGAVAAGDAIEAWEIFDLLASLVDKSLVVADASGEEIRYRYLETTRHYAMGKLAEASEDQWFDRLATYLVALMKPASNAWETAPTATWLATYAPELDNIRAALDWAFGPRGDKATGLEIAAYSYRLFSELNHLMELKRRIGIALSSLNDATPPAITSRIYIAACNAEALGTGTISALEAASRAVELARLTDDPLLLCLSLVSLTRYMKSKEALADALALTDEALAILKPLDQTKRLGYTLNSRAIIEATNGNLAAAKSTFEEALVVARATQHGSLEAVLLSNIALCSARAGNIEAAMAEVRAAISVARAVSAREAEQGSMTFLACLLTVESRTEEAILTSRAALRTALELGKDRLAAELTVYFAAAAAHFADFSTAARLQSFADTRSAAGHFPLSPLDLRINARTHETLAAALPEAELRRLTLEGAAMTVDEASALALTITA